MMATQTDRVFAEKFSRKQLLHLLLANQTRFELFKAFLQRNYLIIFVRRLNITNMLYFKYGLGNQIPR
jgi:hypothetical protein